ncbi:MAG: NTP transferase domain-containing protein [Fretibacterium sp.]|nr:NTP transferase domain-containing protein [Fretibacterium sp.]
MTPVIAVVGAGGKSSYIERLADDYSARGRRVCVTSTTHIYKQPDRENVVYRGAEAGEKLAWPGDTEFARLRREYDVVLVEADGSRHCPIKIPAEYEPVIPRPVDEIAVIMGLHALGRPMGEVCQRFGTADTRGLRAAFPGLDAETPVTREMVDFISQTYYIEPLRRKYPDIPVKYVRNNLLLALPDQAGRRVALVLMTSGSSRRFGENKLLYPVRGRALFRHGLDALLGAKLRLEEDKIEAEVFVTGGNSLECGGAEVIDNPDRLEGIAGSIRHGTETAMRRRCDAVLFLAGDQPDFPAEDVARLVREFLCSGKPMGCAYAGHPANPGIFSSACGPDLLGLSGDSGALKLIKQHPERTHYYVVRPEKLLDIDTMNDAAGL